jgi:hypothetical protein
MSPRRIDAPEMAELLNHARPALSVLTEGEDRQLERELAKVARAYGRAQSRVRRLKTQLRAAELGVKDARREMRMLISARRVK